VTRSRIGFLAALTLGLAGLFGTAPSAKAEFFDFTSTINGGPSLTINTAGGNQIILSALNSVGTPHNNATLGTDIVPLDVNANSNTGTVDTVNTTFTLTLLVTDFPTLNGATPSPGTPNPATFTFNGTITGTIGDGSSLLDILSFAPQSGPVAGENYTISYGAFAPPGLASDGRLTLVVRARAVPEPGSIALLGMGGVGALGMFLRRRARASA